MKIDMSKSSTVSTLAYIAIIITALKLGSSIILPFLMAFFLFIIFLPLANKLNKFKIPNIITSLIILTIIIFIIFLLVTFLITSSNDILKHIPMYQDKFNELSPQLVAFFEQFNISLEKTNVISYIEPAKVFNYTTTFFQGMGNIVVNIFLTLVLVMFLLFESNIIFQKAFYFTKQEHHQEKLELFLKSISRYFVLKTFTSLLTAVVVWIMLEYFNLQHAFLFAVLVFILNYIPSVGSILASFPPLFVALLQLNLVDTISIALGYLVINIFIGSFLDPKIMGKDLGLSTFIVFISMVIWGWIFGPLGMFLAVPLTIMVKIICDNSEHYHWVSIILSDNIIENKAKYIK
ncbi:MAG: AI-2E family transporter [Campylobacterota bacterium]|nr:AI-2E family transporter [Campylobacterota bacterium]